eukprot:5457077-Pyramimonas_sp.AAC.1
MPTDFQAQSNLLKALLAAAASPPAAAQGNSTELCEVPRETDASALIPVTTLGVATEGYYASLTVLMAG